MDKATTKKLAEASAKALEAVASEYGVSVRYKSGNYSSTTASLKFEFSDIGDDGVVQTRESEAFTQLAHVYGLKAEDLGATFESRGRTYTIVGLNGRARKMPIQATRDDGKSFKFTDVTVVDALARGRRSK